MKANSVSCGLLDCMHFIDVKCHHEPNQYSFKKRLISEKLQTYCTHTVKEDSQILCCRKHKTAAHQQFVRPCRPTLSRVFICAPTHTLVVLCTGMARG